MEKESFIFKKAWRDAIIELPEKVRAEVYVAIIEYGLTGEAPELKSMARMAFAFVKSDIDRENNAAEEREVKSERMRKVVMSRWQKVGAYKKEESPRTYARNTNVDTHVYTDVNTQKTPTPSRAPDIGNQKTEDDNQDIDNNIQEEERESGKRKTKTPPLTPPPGKPPRGTLSATIEGRKQAFYTSLIPYVAQYGKETIRAFFDYWSECNKSRTKMRFELQKTWETPRRLATWASRDNNFSSRTNGSNRTDNQEQVRQRADDALAIMRQLRSEGEAADQVGNDSGLRNGT